MTIDSDTPAKARKNRPAKVTPLAQKALALFASGEAKTVTAAAKALGVKRESVSRALNTEAVKNHIIASARLDALNAVSWAMTRKIQMVDSPSDRVASEAASEILAIGGHIVAPRPAAVNVEFNTRHEDNRYVLNLTGFPEAAVVDELMRDPTLLDGGLTLGKGSVPRLEQLANEGHIQRSHEAAMSAAPAAERPQLEPHALLPDSRWVRPVGNRA